jgi:Sigma-70, region 4
LIARYAEELPEAEIAARLGVSAGAIAVRLHRGKLALRRLLTTDLSQEAAAYGLTGSDSAWWQETRIWCPTCGRRRLLGHFNAAQGELILRCPGCSEEPGYCMLDHRICHGLFAGVKTFKPALNRVMQWADVYYRAGLAARMVRCARCGRPAPLRMGCPADSLRALHGEPGIHVACGCGSLNFSTLGGMALYTPEGRRFWRAHPRIRTLPQREAEIAGHPAILVSYDSLTDLARLDVAFARDTLQIVGIHVTPGA